MNQATDSALRYVIGHMSMNDILTTGRSVVRENTWKALNEIIKSYDMGLEVIDVNFQSARPPEEVKDAFDDAIKAQEDEQRFIREAEAYAREKEPIARGDAQRILEEATAYKDRIVLDAKVKWNVCNACCQNLRLHQIYCVSVYIFRRWKSDGKYPKSNA